jgi:uncharacterized protein
MIAEEKLNRLVHTNVNFDVVLTALGILLAAAVVAFFIYLRRLFREKHAEFNQAAPVQIEGLELFSFIFLLFLVSVMRSTYMLFYPATILGTVFLLKGNGVHLPEFWGLRRYKFGRLLFLSLWLCLVVFAMLLPVSLVVDWFCKLLQTPVKPQDSVNILLESQDRLQTAWLLFTAVFLAPLAEEMLFRGFLYPFFKSKMPAFLALTLTSLLFAYIHFDMFTFLQLFLLALFLAAIFEHTGSLPLCIGVHMCFNLCNAIWLLMLKYLP